MITPIRLERSEAVVPRAHYENVIYDTLSAIWQRKRMIGAIVAGALVAQSLALVYMGPRYTGEATIQLNFTREENETGPKSHPIATVDATAVVDGAVRIIRSRTTASAVVTRLGLDKDPGFAHEPLLWRVFAGLRSALGLTDAIPSPHDLAVNALIRRVAVTNEPRSYLISVAVTANDPEHAARLANAVAFEYLRGQLLQQLTDSYATVEREVTELSSIYGARHPSYLSGKTRLERLQEGLRELREGAPNESLLKLVVGQSLVPAKAVLVPSGPNLPLSLALTAGAALVAGAWLAWFLQRGFIRWDRSGDSAVIDATAPGNAGGGADHARVPVVPAIGRDRPIGPNGKFPDQAATSQQGLERRNDGRT